MMIHVLCQPCGWKSRSFLADMIYLIDLSTLSIISGLDSENFHCEICHVMTIKNQNKNSCEEKQRI